MDQTTQADDIMPAPVHPDTQNQVTSAGSKAPVAPLPSSDTTASAAVPSDTAVNTLQQRLTVQLNPQDYPEIPPHILSFLGSLLAEAGMGDLEADIQKEMVKELFERLDQFLIATLAEALSDEKIEEFVEINKQQKSPEEIENFLRENVPGLDQKMAQAFTEFRNMYVNGVGMAQQQQG